MASMADGDISMCTDNNQAGETANTVSASTDEASDEGMQQDLIAVEVNVQIKSSGSLEAAGSGASTDVCDDISNESETPKDQGSVLNINRSPKTAVDNANTTTQELCAEEPIDSSSCQIRSSEVNDDDHGDDDDYTEQPSTSNSKAIGDMRNTTNDGGDNDKFAGYIVIDDVEDEQGSDDDDDDNDEYLGPQIEEDATKEIHQHDPFHYTKTEEFTSEIFKVELGNIPRKCGYKQIKKMIQSRLDGIGPVKVKLVPNSNHAFITFRSEEERKMAVKSLNAHKWKGRWIYARPAKALPDPVIQQRAAGLARKRTIEDAASANNDVKRHKTLKEKKPKHDETLAISIRLNHSVTPLWDQPYGKQIATKYRGIVDVLKKLSKQLRNIITIKGNWVQEECEKRNGMCCALEECIPSPTLDGYRNKCEFTIAEGPDGEKTVGFRLGSYRDGYSGVVDSSECIHISEMAKSIAKTFQSYIRKSPLPTYCLCFHTGYWQTLTARTTMKGDSMAILQFSPQNMSKEEIEEEKGRILNYFTEGEGKELNLTSLYLQINPTRAVGGNAEAPFTLLMGQEHIYEEMFGLKFRISPDAFFQVNTKAAEKMFGVIKQWCASDEEEGKDTIIMDICCGTGTIGLALAKGVKRVIGIEIIENAVRDAKVNAELNEITNTQFVAGKAEDVIVDIMKNLPKKTKVIGIMDPPRAGLQQSVLHALRKCRKMEKLIYVSCNPSAAFNNFLDLCRPTSKRLKTSPFRLVKAVPIDLFPHTKHCELLMLFERDELSTDAAKYYKLYY